MPQRVSASCAAARRGHRPNAGQQFANARPLDEMVEAFAAAFGRVDLLVTPSVAARRKVIGDDRIGDQHYRPVLSWFSALVNHAGLPAIAMPLTIVADSTLPPPSLQIIAPWWREEVLLALASRLENEGLAGMRPPPHHIAG